MGFIDWLKGLLQESGDSDAYWIHVRCNQCQEVLRTRVDLAHDLSVEYDQNGRVEGYFTRKVLIGNNICFNEIETKVHFDERKRAQSHEVHGGQLITKEEYEKARSQERAEDQAELPG